MPCRCVIAELFADGRTSFDLSQLLDYCNEEYSSDAILKRISDKYVRVGIICIVIGTPSGVLM